jgi:Protein of unknown function (DUF1778)
MADNMSTFDLMVCPDDETPRERAALLLADRTRFQLSPDAWDELVAIMDRGARSNPKLVNLLSCRSDAQPKKRRQSDFISTTSNRRVA